MDRKWWENPIAWKIIISCILCSLTGFFIGFLWGYDTTLTQPQTSASDFLTIHTTYTEIYVVDKDKFIIETKEKEIEYDESDK